ncbi:MAG: glycerol-3-phosphate acyltransferase [Deltaproteobacteria bacterium]|nr:MAG: glycerol-3-phosphate acyltransferase [Deltaproteobacteria bacterium]
MRFILLFTAAYIAGSINVSIGLFRILGREDPRARFSGNPGATNVYRQAGLGWAVGVLILEMGKAVSLAFVALSILPLYQVPWIGLGLIIGNRLPCFHRFRGGKGVANYLGFVLALSPLSCGIGMILWLTAYGATRQPFIGSFMMVMVLAIGTLARCGTDGMAVAGTLLTAGIIYYAHKKNVRELIAGYRDQQ